MSDFDLVYILSELIQYYHLVQQLQQKKNNCLDTNTVQQCWSNLQWVSVHKLHDYGMTVEVNRLWDRITVVMKSLETTTTKKILTSVANLYLM